MCRIHPNNAHRLGLITHKRALRTPLFSEQRMLKRHKHPPTPLKNSPSSINQFSVYCVLYEFVNIKLQFKLDFMVPPEGLFFRLRLSGCLFLFALFNASSTSKAAFGDSVLQQEYLVSKQRQIVIQEIINHVHPFPPKKFKACSTSVKLRKMTVLPATSLIWLAHCELRTKLGMLRHLRHVSALVTMDIANAFHSVLLGRLQSIGSPQYTVAWVQECMSY